MTTPSCPNKPYCRPKGGECTNQCAAAHVEYRTKAPSTLPESHALRLEFANSTKEKQPCH